MNGVYFSFNKFLTNFGIRFVNRMETKKMKKNVKVLRSSQDIELQIAQVEKKIPRLSGDAYYALCGKAKKLRQELRKSFNFENLSR